MIIAISGYKHSGKTTAAGYIADNYGYEEYALASPLKAALTVMFGYDHSHMYGPKKDEEDPRFGISPRQMLQTLGTEWGQFDLQAASTKFRVVTGRDLWVKRFYYMVWKPGVNYVISDVRFQHEIQALKDIDTTYSVMVLGGLDDDDHASEERNLKTDVVIDNDGSVEDLYKSLDILMEYARA